MKYRALTNGFLSVLNSELAMLVQAGVPLGDGLLMMLDDAEDGDAGAVIKNLFDVIDGGRPLSEALERAGYFPAYMAGMVKTGEKTGRLGESLAALAEYYDSRERMEKALKDAVFYPAVLFAVMVGVVLVLIMQVLPIFNEVFARLGSRMSPVALRLMRFGQWLGGASAVMAGLAGVVLLCCLVLWLLPGLRARLLGAARYRWGGAGVFGEAASAHFASAMALSLASGLDVDEAVEIAGALSGGTKETDRRNADCAERLKNGASLPEAMRGAKLLSARDERLLALGFKSGGSDSAMADISRRMERDVRDKTDAALSRVEPALVIAASVVVGAVLLSVMLPLMGVMSAIG